MICKHCGTENAPHAAFCEKCGAPMPKENLWSRPTIDRATNSAPVCRSCGASLKPGVRFCGKCGAPAYAAPVAEAGRFCPECGGPLKDDFAFCEYCGAPVSGAKKEKPARPEKKKSKNGKTGLIVLLAILGALILGLGVWVITMFPLNISADVPKSAQSTVSAELKRLKVTVKSNQPIVSVLYAIDPGVEGEEPEFTDAGTSFGLGSRTVTVDKLELMPGDNDLILRVGTLFGNEDVHVTIRRDIGYVAEPDQDALVPIGSSAYLVSNDLILVFRDDATQEEIDAMLDRYQGTVVGRNYVIGEYQVRFTGSGERYINELKSRIASEPLVAEAFYDMTFDCTPDYIPNDSRFDDWNVDQPGGNNWWLEAVDAPGAWEYRDQLKTIKIGVIDTWLRYDHEDIAVNKNHTHFLQTENFSSMDDVLAFYRSTSKDHSHHYIYDSDGHKHCLYCEMCNHGTHCSGIAAAKMNNGKGIAGVASNADLYFSTFWYLTVYADNQIDTRDTYSTTLYNITYLVSSGCRVISMSVGNHRPKSSMTAKEIEYEEDMIMRYENGIKALEESGYDFLLFKAAGNSSELASNDQFTRVLKGGPHSSAHTVIVGSINNSSSIENRFIAWQAGYNYIYNLSGFSNYGDYVDVVAPGTNVYSTVANGDYRELSGTSMATPLAAGVACMIYGAAPGLRYSQVKSILTFTSNHFSIDRRNNVYNVVNAKNAVEWVLNHGQSLPERPAVHLGYVNGTVIDAKTQVPISEAAVKLTRIDTNETTLASILETNPDDPRPSEGVYYAAVEPGRYNIEFYADGYFTETLYNVEINEGAVTYNMKLSMVTEEYRQGRAGGRIIDAYNAAGIPNAALTIYKGINAESGTPVKTLYSDSDGLYQVDLDPGNYTIVAEADGYIRSSANIVVIPGEARTDQNCSMTPNIYTGQTRIVLTWGEYPLDLDSHLVGPKPDAGRFHVFYDNKNYYYGGTEYAMLDVDDTDSYGPETTTIYIPVDGTYTFYVHDYNNRASTYSTSMALSDAQVRVYMAGRSEPYVFNVPNQNGTLWAVFSITNGVLEPINTMSYAEYPSDIGMH